MIAAFKTPISALVAYQVAAHLAGVLDRHGAIAALCGLGFAVVGIQIAGVGLLWIKR